MVSKPVCHFGGFFGGRGLPILRRCRRAMRSSATPITILAASAASEGAVLGLGGLFPVSEDGDRNHDREGEEPAEDEGGPFPRAALRQEDQDEGGEGDRLERDDEAYENEVEDHATPGPAATSPNSSANIRAHGQGSPNCSPGCGFRLWRQEGFGGVGGVPFRCARCPPLRHGTDRSRCAFTACSAFSEKGRRPSKAPPRLSFVSRFDA